jgi:hypothetical protein
LWWGEVVSAQAFFLPMLHKHRMCISSQEGDFEKRHPFLTLN